MGLCNDFTAKSEKNLILSILFMQQGTLLQIS